MTGLEPATNFPNTRSYEAEQGRVVQLEPGGTTEMKLRMDVYPDPDQVHTAEMAVTALQTEAPQIFDRPRPTWCENA